MSPTVHITIYYDPPSSAVCSPVCVAASCGASGSPFLAPPTRSRRAMPSAANNNSATVGASSLSWSCSSALSPSAASTPLSKILAAPVSGRNGRSASLTPPSPALTSSSILARSARRTEQPSPLRTNLSAFQVAGRQCECVIPHDILSGKVMLPTGGWHWNTALAGRYRHEFCAVVARALLGSAPRGGLRGVGEPTLHPYRLRSVNASHAARDAAALDAVSVGPFLDTDWNDAVHFSICDKSRERRAAALARIGLGSEVRPQTQPLVSSPRASGCRRSLLVRLSRSRTLPKRLANGAGTTVALSRTARA